MLLPVETVRRQLAIVVYGRPAPQGSKSRIGRAMIESSKYLKPWREAVKFAALERMDAEPLHTGPLAGPLTLCVVFTLARPKRLARKHDALPAVRPDVDKLLRSTMDGLTDAGVWHDDAQVVSVGNLWKRYATESAAALRADILTTPGAVIRVYQQGETT